MGRETNGNEFDELHAVRMTTIWGVMVITMHICDLDFHGGLFDVHWGSFNEGFMHIRASQSFCRHFRSREDLSVDTGMYSRPALDSAM